MATMTSHGLSLREDQSSLALHRWPFYMGIELELENVSGEYNNMLYSDNAKWSLHDDASLRNGIEFVSIAPLAGDQLTQALDQFYDGVHSYSAGPRTSTHIHVNITDVTDDVVKSMFFLMYFLEEGVYALTEESRKWAGYSMALREMAPSRIRNILQPFTASVWRNACHGGRNSERYYGFNINWARHGTVEFRYFPGGPSREELEYWLDLPTAVKRVAKLYNVEQLASMFNSPQQLVSFIRSNFGRWGADITNAVPAETLMQYYEEVSSLYGDVTNPVNSNVIYVGSRLRNLINKNLFKGEEEKTSLFQRFLPQEAVTADGLGTSLHMVVTQVQNTSAPQFRSFSDAFTYSDPYDDSDYDPDREDEDVQEIAPSPEPEQVLPIRPWRVTTRDNTVPISPADRYPNFYDTISSSAAQLSVDEYTAMVNSVLRSTPPTRGSR